MASSSEKTSAPTSTPDLSIFIDRAKKQNPRGRLELVRMGASTGEPVMTWTPLAELEDPADTAAEARQLAEAEGAQIESATGRIAFRLRVMNETGQQVGQTLFNVPAAPKGAGHEAPADLATGFGQMLRALVDMSGIIVRRDATQFDGLAEQNRMLIEQLSEMRREQYEHGRALQKQALFEAEQKRMSITHKREEERDAFFFEQFQRAIPILLNRFAGGGHGKGAPMGDAMLENFFKSLTPEQGMAIFDSPVFTQQQKDMLLELYQSFSARPETPLNRDRPAEEAHTNGTNGAANGHGAKS